MNILLLLSFLKEFAERRSFSEITDDYQELVTLTMAFLLSLSSIIHWKVPGPILYAHGIAKVMYALSAIKVIRKALENQLWYVSI